MANIKYKFRDRLSIRLAFVKRYVTANLLQRVIAGGVRFHTYKKLIAIFPR